MIQTELSSTSISTDRRWREFRLFRWCTLAVIQLAEGWWNMMWCGRILNRTSDILVRRQVIHWLHRSTPMCTLSEPYLSQFNVQTNNCCTLSVNMVLALFSLAIFSLFTWSLENERFYSPVQPPGMLILLIYISDTCIFKKQLKLFFLTRRTRETL